MAKTFRTRKDSRKKTTDTHMSSMQPEFGGEMIEMVEADMKKELNILDTNRYLKQVKPRPTQFSFNTIDNRASHVTVKLEPDRPNSKGAAARLLSLDPNHSEDFE